MHGEAGEEETVRHVARAIAEHGAEFGAEIIALCTHGSGGMRDLLLGSIAQQTLKQGSGCVLLVRPGPAGEAPAFVCREVVMALDPQRHDTGGIEAAAAVARCCGSELRLVSVVPTAASLPPARQPMRTLLPRTVQALLDLEGEDARAVVEEIAAQLRQQGLHAVVEVRRGEPVAEVAESLRARDADLLVVATHARVGLGGWVSGSFAQRILAQTRLPILLVRAGG